MNDRIDTLLHTLRVAGRRAEAIAQGNLNYGGCCVFAVIVGEELRRLSIEPRIVVKGGFYIAPPSIELDEVRPVITNVEDAIEWNRNGVEFGHVGLRFQLDNGITYLYDSTGPAKEGDHMQLYSLYRGTLSLEDGKLLAGNWHNWNRMFDRDCVPTIRKVVRHVFCASGLTAIPDPQSSFAFPTEDDLLLKELTA